MNYFCTKSYFRLSKNTQFFIYDIQKITWYKVATFFFATSFIYI